MARRPLSSRETGLEAFRSEVLEKIERGECHGCVQPRAVKGISNKVAQP
jgi:hypothetical protein